MSHEIRQAQHIFTHSVKYNNDKPKYKNYKTLPLHQQCQPWGQSFAVTNIKVVSTSPIRHKPTGDNGQLF